MNLSIFRTITIAVTMFLCAGSLFAATIAAGSGSYTDTLPSGLTGPATEMHHTANVTGALPTNEWWSSILFSTTPYRMYAYPLTYRCQKDGLLIGHARVSEAADFVYAGKDDAAPYRQQLLVNGMYGSTAIDASEVRVDGYSDWAVKTACYDKTDSSKYYRATFGQGMLFTYFDFSSGVNARISFPLDWAAGQFDTYRMDGSIVGWNVVVATGCVSLRFLEYGTSKEVWYGIFAPSGSTVVNNGHEVTITFPGDDARYLSVGLMNAKADLATWEKYAYAFVTDTKVSWTVDEAHSKVSTTFTATTQARQYGQTTTLMALFPHQKKNSTNTYLSQQFSTLRGTMSVVAANTFTVTNNCNGILPMLPDRGDHDLSHLKSLLASDKTMSFIATGEYWHGKELMKLAGLIPVANQTGDIATRTALLTKLKSDLTSWFTYTPGETTGFFYYNTTWGSLFGYGNEYGSENFTDQHFHFGMFVYASAILATYDPSFADQYGPMVELLIRSYASPDRADTKFPFLRTFSPYEGHSWADGRALSDDGNNQESSSEAMNSWAAIYLWGLAAGNNTYRDLGIYGYTTEYTAIREYYFDVDDDIYKAPFNHNAIGILWGGRADHNTWFGNQPEDIHGIQFLPENPSMLYLGYNTAYAQSNYNEIVSENGGAENSWQDIIWKFQALFDPAAALAKYSESTTLDSGDSASALYHWLHFFSAAGSVDTSIYADTPAYGVFNKSGTRLYACLNLSAAPKTVKFYRFSDSSLVGSVTVDPYSLASTFDFSSVKQESIDPLSAPSSFSGDAQSPASISWSWQPVTGARYYTVYASSDNSVLARLTYPATSWLEAGLPANTNYRRYVWAGTYASVDGAASAACATYALPPTGGQLTGRTLNTISLSWDDNGAAGFTVTRSSDNVVWKTAGTTVSAAYADTGLRLATTWYYRVYAQNSDGALNPDNMQFSAATLMLPASLTLLSAAAASAQEQWVTDPALGRIGITLPAGCLITDGFIIINTDADTAAQDASTASLDAATLKLISSKNTLVAGSITELHFYDLTGSTITVPFSSPVTLTMPYADANSDGLVDGLTNIRVETLRVIVFNPATLSWDLVGGTQRLDTSAHTLSCSLNHFSIYALASISALRQDLSNVIVYPNPYKPGSGTAYDNTSLGRGMIFSHLTPSARIRVYNVAGELVAEREESDGDGMFLWDTCNDAGERVASGVYIYYVTGPDGSGQKARGKLAIIR